MISSIIWDIDPNIFEELEFPRWYGVCWALGMMLGYLLIQCIYQQEGKSQSNPDKLLSYLIIGVMIGARLGHVFFYEPRYYLENPIEILPIRLKPHFAFTGLAGLASHGGIVGTFVALYLYSRKYKTDSLWTLDRLVIGGALLGGFIRLGNLVNSEIIGTPTNVPWAFIFSHIDGIPRHPAQLYEAIFYFLIAFILYMTWKSKIVTHSKGFLFGLGITLIFLQRFLVEFVKENQVPFEDGLLLNMGQLLSIPLIIVGIFFMTKGLRSSAVNP